MPWGMLGVRTKCAPPPAAAHSRLPRHGTWPSQADAPLIPSTTALIISALLRAAGETWAPARRPGTGERGNGKREAAVLRMGRRAFVAPRPLFRAANAGHQQLRGRTAGQGSGFPQERFTRLLPTTWETEGDTKRGDAQCHCRARASAVDEAPDSFSTPRHAGVGTPGTALQGLHSLSYTRGLGRHRTSASQP